MVRMGLIDCRKTGPARQVGPRLDYLNPSGGKCYVLYSVMS